jgi:hypothetical protein
MKILGPGEVVRYEIKLHTLDESKDESKDQSKDQNVDLW